MTGTMLTGTSPARELARDAGFIANTLEGVYSAALDPSRWAAVMPQLAQLAEAQTAQLGFMDKRDPMTMQFAIAHGYPPSAAEIDPRDYMEACMKDPYMLSILREPNRFHSDYRPEEEWFRKSDAYIRHRAPNGLHNVLSACLNLDENRYAIIAFCRDDSMGGFAHEQADALNWLLPHITRASQIQVNMVKTLQQSHITDMLDVLGQGVLTVKPCASIIASNSIANDMLAQSPHIARLNGRLVLTDTPQSHSLRDALVDLAKGHRTAPFGMMLGNIQDAEDEPPIFIIAMRPPKADTGSTEIIEDGAMIMRGKSIDELALILSHHAPMGHSAGSDHRHITILRDMFSLTEKEARVALALKDGAEVADIASRMGVEVSTVRSHLKNLYAKTNTNRQGGLIALLARLPMV